MRDDAIDSEPTEMSACSTGRADLIDAFVPVHAPMPMPLQALEVSWSERLGLVGLPQPLGALSDQVD